MFVSRAGGPSDAARHAADWSAHVLRKDGTTVAVLATNYVDARHPTRPAPVLDLQQIEALAADRAWFRPVS